MISKCPHCANEINLSDAQKAKLKDALAKLKPGASLKFPCPSCKKPIEMNAATQESLKSVPPTSAPPASVKPAHPSLESNQKSGEFPKPIKPPPTPPGYPDISWLIDGKMEEKAVIEDVPTAMLLMKDTPDRKWVADAFKTMGYQLYFPQTADEAIQSMRFKDYSAAVFHSRFEGGKLEDSVFHAHIRNMSMNKRRYLYYVLIGPEFHTLYDLEALAFSANIVINDKELKHMNILLKKGKGDYEALFNPYIAMLKAHNKK